MSGVTYIVLMLAFGYLAFLAFPALMLYCSDRFASWLNVYNPKRYRQLFEVEFTLKQSFLKVWLLPIFIIKAVIEAKFGKIRIVKKRIKQ